MSCDVRMRFACQNAARRSQVKSAPAPVGVPNLRAEAEKKNIDTPRIVQPMQASLRKHGSTASDRTAFLATISKLPKALYLQNISNLVSQACCGRPREGYIGSGCHAYALLTQRSVGKIAM